MPQNSYHKKLVHFLFLFFVTLIVGCSNASNQADGELVTQEPSAPPLPTIAPTKTPEILLTPTNTLEILPTYTPLPKLSGEETEDVIFQYINDNGDCQFPCIWGMTPEKTTIEALKHFLNQFRIENNPGSIITKLHHDADSGGLTLLSWEKNVRTIITFGYSVENNSIFNLQLTFSQSLESVEGLTLKYDDVFGRASFLEKFHDYTLPEILGTYGPPTEVLIYPLYFDEELEQMPPPSLVPFSLVLIYRDQGFLVEYISPLTKEGNDYVGCPIDSMVYVLTWSPNSAIGIEDLAAISQAQVFNETWGEYYKPISEAVGMSIQEFYQVYGLNKDISCLETPADIWPYKYK